MRLERAEIKSVEEDRMGIMKEHVDIRSSLSRRRFSSRTALEGQFWLLRHRSHLVVKE